MLELKKEKKVEYLELIYDLIFVFIIGRNNSLLHHVDNGYVTQGNFLAYVLCTLAVIQIWNFTAETKSATTSFFLSICTCSTIWLSEYP